MKKKILLSSLLLTTALFFNSCSDDDLKIDSPNNLSDESFYKTPADFTIAITGVYDRLKTSGFYGGSSSARDMIIVGDLLSDNLNLNPYGRLTNRLSYEYLYTSNSTPTDIYSNAYVLISDANKILANIDNLADGAFKDQIRAEALALRGLAHFEVARAYSKIPTQSADANNSIGIAYVDTYDPKVLQPTRKATVAEVYDLIINDMESALAALPTADYTTATPYSNTYYRLNKLSLQGLLAKVYLHKGDYAKVIEYAQPVVDAVQPTVKTDLDKFWKTEINQGALFVLPFFKTNDLQLGSNYSQGTSPENYRFEYTVDRELVNQFDSITEPERLEASIILTTQDAFDAGTKVYAVKKYMNTRLNYNGGINDGRYLRVEDVYLMLAEAQFLSGDEGSALATLDKFRDTRYTSYAGGESGEDLFEAIMLERRKELAFEGDRWYTLKRLLGVPGIPAKYAQGIQRSGFNYTAFGTDPNPYAQTLSASSHLWQFPIPQSIILLDPNIIQNQGY